MRITLPAPVASRSPVVDIHAHFVAPALLDEARRHPARYGLTVVAGTGDAYLGAGDGFLFEGGVRARPVFPRLRDAAGRIAEMDAAGIDVAVLMTWMEIVGYWLDGPTAARWSRLQNDTLAETARQHPTRFRALGTVPMQDPAAAEDEVDYVAKRLGLRGIEIAANFGGRELDDPALDRVWRKVVDHGLYVFLHPHHCEPPPRLEPYFFVNLIGNPLDTTIGFARLVYGGVLDRFPGLRVVLAHGGGYVPYQIGRFDRGWETRSECRNIAAAPSAYLDRFWFDTILFDQRRLGFLAAAVGTKRLLFGTDAPFPLGDPAMLERVRATAEIAEAREDVLGGNALALLGETPAR